MPETVRKRVRLAPEERRARLVAAATRQIGDRGLNGFTFSRLAEDSGLTRAGIEHHFASLDDLLVEVLRSRDLEDTAALLPDPSVAVSEEGIWSALDALVERNAGRREIIRLYTVLGVEALSTAHPAHEYFAQRLRETRAQLERGATSWHPDPAAFAVDVLALLDGLQLQWLRDPEVNLVELWRTAAVVLHRRPTRP